MYTLKSYYFYENNSEKYLNKQIAIIILFSCVEGKRMAQTNHQKHALAQICFLMSIGGATCNSYIRIYCTLILSSESIINNHVLLTVYGKFY